MHFTKRFHLTTYILCSSVVSLAATEEHPEHDHDRSPHDVHELDPYVVNATIAPRNSRDMLNPTTVVTADELDRVRGTTLGETLDGQPGVHATAFGAGASRPVIRGMEGVRLKVMESGADSGDLSADSPDHAAAVEPFFIERVEVLRGASTLLFGSSAIGGAVNAIDRRIPRRLIEQASAEAMLEYQSASEGWTYAAIAEVPMEDFVFSASYLDRDQEDYSIPGLAELEAEHHEHHEEDGHEDHGEDHDEDHDDHEEEAMEGTLESSFVDLQVGSLALSWFPSGRTRLSLAWQQTDSLYGVPGHAHAHAEEEHHGDEHVEDEHGEEGHDEEHDHGHDEEHAHEHEGEETVSIDLEQSTVDLEVEHRMTGSWIQSIEGRVRLVDYEHQELEGEEIGTDFDRESIEARFTATHLLADEAPGAIGIHWSALDAKAVGEESLTPESETRDFALFLLQEWHLENLRLEGGLRAEHRDIDATGTGGYEDWAYSASAGSRLVLSEQWSLGLLFNHSRRHPTTTELFANGPHAATRQFQIGDAGLGIESANGIDLSIQFDNQVLGFGLTAFYTDFNDYIFASPTGAEADGLPVYQYRQADVTFRGLEAESTWHVWHGEDAWFDLGLLFDWVDTDIADSPEELPRIPPARAGLRVAIGSDAWTFHSKLLRSFKQDETAPNELPTGAYTNWTASLMINLPFEKGAWRLGIIGENLLDKEIRVHTSTIKALAPAPGRHVRVQLSVAF